MNIWITEDFITRIFQLISTTEFQQDLVNYCKMLQNLQEYITIIDCN